MSAGEFFHTITDPIPGIGTVVSFGLAIGSAFHGDPEKAVAYALDGYQGLVRDSILIATDGAGFELPLAVMHDVATNMTDKAIELLFKSPTTPLEIKKGDSSFEMSREGKKIVMRPFDLALDKFHTGRRSDVKYTHVLIPHEDPNHVQTFLHDLQTTYENDIGRTIKLYGATFVGKFNYADYAKNENIFLVLPSGFYEGAPCYILTTFTEDYWKEPNQELVSVHNPVSISDRTDDSFEVGKRDSDFYVFKGKFMPRWEAVQLQLYHSGSPVEDASMMTLKLC